MTILLYMFQLSVLLSMISSNYDSPFPEIESYQKMGELEIYNPGNLFDIINGAADSYLKYDFEELKLMRYKGDADQFLKIEIYKHSNNANAFGIYSSERPLKGDWVDVGAHGYYESKILNFYKGKYYIKLMGYKIDNIEEFLFHIAQIVADNLEGDNELPDLLEAFPEEGKINFTERYINKSFLGYESLSEVLTVDYKVEEKDFKMFLIQKKSANICRKMLEDYFTSITMDKENIQEGNIQINDPYQGELNLLWDNNIVIGVINCNDSKLNEKYLQQMSSRMKLNK